LRIEGHISTTIDREQQFDDFERLAKQRSAIGSFAMLV
jgi:hypothetical protein